jgi:Prenyltransferase and squalene oxidase repeat
MTDIVTRAREFIAASQNHDGGWGYKPGGMSFVEPTAAVLLALEIDSRATEQVARGREHLRVLQHQDGGWGVAASDEESGWMTAWAVWSLAGSSPTAAASGAEWLVRTEGLRTTDPALLAKERQVLRIDTSLAGWPWQPGDASWVFPTALALLALNAAGHSAHSRAAEGVRYLIDRAIPSGGWNVGSPFMFGSEVPATIVDTALVLIALRRLGITDVAAGKAEAELSRRLRQGGTSAELAWYGWAERESQLGAASTLARFQDLQRADGSWDSNPLTTAVALLALK